MTTAPLRVGITGYGVVGQKRRECIEANSSLAVVAISDITFDSGEMKSDGVHYCANYSELFEHDLDILFVSLPNYLAAEATMAGLNHGLHVFCEKPPGRTIEEVQSIIEVEHQYPNLKLKYGFNHRYHQSVKTAKKIIDSGDFGRVLNLRGVYGKSMIIPSSGGWRSEREKAGGGILLDQGIHMLDMIRYFVGDFDEFKSFVSNDFWHHDVEDNAYAIMRNRNGCVAILHSTGTQWRHKFRLEVTFETALLELTGILSGSKSYGEERLTLVPRNETSVAGSIQETTTSYLDDNSWQEEVDEFASLIINKTLVTNGTSMDAIKVMEMVYQIYYADEQWRRDFAIPNPTRVAESTNQ